MSHEMELLIYLITSAKALPAEPQIYGSIRLTEAASRVCRMLCEKNPESESWKELLSCIESGKGKALTEPEDFMKMLDDASLLLVDCEES